jgi:hypothetical protein
MLGIDVVFHISSVNGATLCVTSSPKSGLFTYQERSLLESLALYCEDRYDATYRHSIDGQILSCEVFVDLPILVYKHRLSFRLIPI